MNEDQYSSPFGVREVIVLIAAGVLLALGYLLLSGFGTEIGRNFGRPAGPLAGQATGFKAIYRLVADSGGDARLIKTSEDYGKSGLLVLTPAAESKAENLKDLLDARGDARTLIVLPKWNARQDPLRRTRERKAGLIFTETVGELLPWIDGLKVEQDDAKRARIAPGLGLRPFHVPQSLQTISGAGLRPLIQAQSGGAVLAQLKGSKVFILADPDLLNNHGLRRESDAIAAVTMLQVLAKRGPILFDTALHYRPGERNMIKLMFTPPFLAVTIALAAAAFLAGIAALARFGPARREERALAFGKAALIDNIVALTRLAGRTSDGGEHYAEAIREWAARRMRAPRGLAAEALDSWIDAHSRSAVRFSDLQARARAARTETEMLHAARALDDWRKELTA